MSDKLHIALMYGELRAEFEGEPEEAMRFLIRFIEDNLPSYSLARRITISVDVERLIAALEEYVGFSREDGFFLRPGFRDLPYSDQILVFLAKRRIEHMWGYSESASMGMKEITEGLGMGKGTSSARLTELLRKGLVKRLERGDYAITTSGLQELIERMGTRAPRA